jgi:hypothetical protein
MRTKGMRTMVTRRASIWGGLAGVTVLATGGLAWRAWSNGAFSVGQGEAYEPWRRWREDRPAGRLGVVHAGILAASAHNTQPWRFRIANERISLHADYGRNLGSFDPFRRELHLSLGCALENMTHAARAQGFLARIEAAPGPLASDSSGAAAEITLVAGERIVSELFEAIPNRHTLRGAYDARREISSARQKELGQLAEDSPELRMFLFADAAGRAELGALIVSATERIVADREMAEDSARWFRFDWSSLQSHRDGITLDAVGLPPLINAVAKILPPVSGEQADRQWLTDTRDVHVATAPLLGIIAVRDLYDRPTALAAGRLWQRIHLWATARGISAQPLNQPAEMVDRERQLGAPEITREQLAKLTGDPSWRPTFVFRLGYADQQARLSPRRRLEDVVIQ